MTDFPDKYIVIHQGAESLDDWNTIISTLFALWDTHASDDQPSNRLVSLVQSTACLFRGLFDAEVITLSAVNAAIDAALGPGHDLVLDTTYIPVRQTGPWKDANLILREVGIVDYDPAVHDRSQFYVTITGSPSGTGAEEDPLDLITAIEGYVPPGGEIIVDDGAYNILSALDTASNGETDSRIRIYAQNWRGARLNFEGVSLGLSTNHLEISGFHVTKQFTKDFYRETYGWSNQSGGFAGDGPFEDIIMWGNFVDSNIGDGIHSSAFNHMLIESNVFLNPGLTGGSHTAYAQNNDADTPVIFNNNLCRSGPGIGFTLHSLHTASLRQGLVVSNNTFIDCSEGGTAGNMYGIIAVPGRSFTNSAAGIFVQNNVFYFSPGAFVVKEQDGPRFRGQVQIGPSDLDRLDTSIDQGTEVTDNIIAANSLVVSFQENFTFTGNTIRVNLDADNKHAVVVVNPSMVWDSYVWDNNTYVEHDGGTLAFYVGATGEEAVANPLTFAEWKTLTGLDENSTVVAEADDQVIINENAMADEWAHITILNWSEAEDVDVDLSGVSGMQIGVTYRLYSLMDMDEYLEFEYDGNPVSVPMQAGDWNVSDLDVNHVYDFRLPLNASTFPKLGAFVLVAA